MKAQTTRKRNLRNLRESASRSVNKMLEAWLSKLEDNLFVVWLVAKNTLTAMVMALFVLSPVIVYPFLIGWPEPYCYVAYVIWIAWFIGSCILTAIVGYLSETQKEK